MNKSNSSSKRTGIEDGGMVCNAPESIHGRDEDGLGGDGMWGGEEERLLVQHIDRALLA